MVNVEADVLAGPLLAEEARSRGIVYSMAYGDQPALTCELVDWARACGFEVVAAGKGTKYLPTYNAVTPDGVWGHYGLTPEEARAGGMNPQMFNSFLDGTKSAIEMAAIANATGLAVPADGLGFPACGVDDLPHVLRGREAGGVLQRDGMVEVVSCLERDGRPVFRDLRWGVYVVLKAPNEYTRTCFKEYGLRTDASGWYAAMYKPYHLIGLELGISVLSAALRGEPTGQTRGFNGDVVAVAKRALSAGEPRRRGAAIPCGAKLVPAARSLAEGAVPIGLAHGVKLVRDVDRPARALVTMLPTSKTRRCGRGATWSGGSRRARRRRSPRSDYEIEARRSKWPTGRTGRAAARPKTTSRPRCWRGFPRRRTRGCGRSC
jgi:predicted homoserine dehydrogenase-like protein